MRHFRAHYHSYLMAALFATTLSAITFGVAAPVLGIRFTAGSFMKVAIILLVAGAILRALLHIVDSADHAHEGAPSSSPQG